MFCVLFFAHPGRGSPASTPEEEVWGCRGGGWEVTWWFLLGPLHSLLHQNPSHHHLHHLHLPPLEDRVSDFTYMSITTHRHTHTVSHVNKPLDSRSSVSVFDLDVGIWTTSADVTTVIIWVMSSSGGPIRRHFTVLKWQGIYGGIKTIIKPLGFLADNIYINKQKQDLSCLYSTLTFCLPIMLCRLRSWRLPWRGPVQRSWERGRVLCIHGYRKLCIFHGYSCRRHGDRHSGYRRWVCRRDVLERFENQRQVFRGHGDVCEQILRWRLNAHSLCGTHKPSLTLV